MNTFLWDIIAFFITLYQKTISPDKGIFSPILKGRICAHEPHCSAYGKECLHRYWFRPWIAYTMQRIITCTPHAQKNHDPSHYRVVFFSGSPIGVPFLQELNNNPHFEIVGVVTMPDKAIGRGHTVQENIIKKTANDLGVTTILTPPKINPQTSDDGKAVAAQLQSLHADYFVVVAYGKILPQSILDIPRFWSINVHGSILPAYRGASPLQSVFLNSEKKTWITIMHMNTKMDEGDIISTYEFGLPFTWTSKELFEKVMKVWPKHLTESLWDLGKWHIVSHSQDNEKATYCSKIEKEDGYIDLWKTPLSTVYNKHRAYALRPKIWTTSDEKIHKLDGKNIVIEKLELDENIYQENTEQPVILSSKDNGKVLLNPAIKSLLLKPEGKKAMDRQSFKNGYLQ